MYLLDLRNIPQHQRQMLPHGKRRKKFQANGPSKQANVVVLIPDKIHSKLVKKG